MYCFLLLHTPRVLKVASFSSFLPALLFTHPLSLWGRIAGRGGVSLVWRRCPGGFDGEAFFLCQGWYLENPQILG